MVKEEIIAFGRSRWAPALGTGLLGVGIGVGIGYLLTRRKVVSINTEIEDIKQTQLELDFERADKDREFNLQIQQAALVARELRESGENFLRRLNVGPERIEQAVAEHARATAAPVVSNVFDTAGDEWDYAIELNHRRGRSIYILHIDEYMADENEWNSQSTLTWYEGDEILCDSKDTPIYNPDSIVGDLQFGHGSNDPNVCYVRNERLQAEYEVLKDPGSYEIEVLGGQVEERERKADIRHAHSPRKFRED
jgi:hypothetical protein